MDGMLLRSKCFTNVYLLLCVKTKCVSCHGRRGEGKAGPNLTDDHWKNVRNVDVIAKVIENGAANGSMAAWKNCLSHQNQIVFPYRIDQTSCWISLPTFVLLLGYLQQKEQWDD
jgi:hypothetical protein